MKGNLFGVAGWGFFWVAIYGGVVLVGADCPEVCDTWVMRPNEKPLFQIRECGYAGCRFRFPVVAGSEVGERCPRCGAETGFVTEPFGGHGVERPERRPRLVVEGLLDNIRSAYNVGAIFRTADGAAVSHLHLCGMTATPENRQVGKTALGAEMSVPWTYYNNGLDAARGLKDRGYRLWAVEGGEGAESLFEGMAEKVDGPILLIVGNEVSGVDPALLDLCERVFYIPMYGGKASLNVEVAFGIVAYALRQAFG